MGPVHLYFIITGMKNVVQTHDNDFFFSIYTKKLRSLSTKVMIFNSFIAVRGFNFGTQITGWP